MTIIGYARVSTQGQTLDAQVASLTAAGATHIFQEKISGAKANRPELLKMMGYIGRGDVVLVTKIDRLGRSTRELLDLLHKITQTDAAFKSLGDPLWDTSTPQGRLLSTLLAAIAEFERELIVERTSDGRARAKLAGVKFGRKRKLNDHQRAEALKRREQGESCASIARLFNVDPAMIQRL